MQVLAVHVFHRQEVFAVGLRDVVHAADTRVGDLARQTSLIAKASQPGRIRGHRRVEELQRDSLPERDVLSTVHHAHPAASKLGNDAVATRNDRAGA